MGWRESLRASEQRRQSVRVHFAQWLCRQWLRRRRGVLPVANGGGFQLCGIGQPPWDGFRCSKSLMVTGFGTLGRLISPNAGERNFESPVRQVLHGTIRVNLARVDRIILL